MASSAEDDQLFKRPKGIPPQTKRGSLPTIEISNSSQTSLLRDVQTRSGSFSNLVNLKEQQLGTRTLSASNLAALSDNNLSLIEATPQRPYDAPFTFTYIAKYQFEKTVRQYFFQLRNGCSSDKCCNKLCASGNPIGCSKLSTSLALVMSLELASRQYQGKICFTKYMDKPLPKIFKDDNEDKSPPFIEALLSCSPFKTLYTVPKQDSIIAQRAVLDNPHTSIRPVRHGAASLTASMENLYCKVGARKTSFSESDTRPILGRQLSNSLGSLHPCPGENFYSALAVGGRMPFSGLDRMRQESRNSSMTSVNSDLDSVCSHEDLLADLDNIDDAERQLALDFASLGGAQQFSLTHLNVPMLRAVVEKYVETNDPTFLQNTIRTVFMSSEALTDSFRKNESLPSGSDNLDIAAVKIAYDLILNNPNRDIFRTVLINSIELHLSSLLCVNIEPPEVSQLIILLECPYFKRRMNHMLRQKYSSVVSSLSQASKVELCKHLLNYDSESFERRMGMFRDHFLLSLCPKQRAEPHIMDMAATLSVFFMANKLAEVKLGVPIIPKRMFYISDLGKKLDYKSEHENWFRINNDVPSPSSEKPVSLLNYPFLLDPSSKVHALHLGAVIEMRQHYQEAILHQARISQLQQIFLREKNKSLNLPNSIKSAMCPYFVLEVRRDNLIEDAIAQIKIKSSDLKKPLRIKYVGGGEQGVDYGGLQKEFFQLVCEKIFGSDYGMFLEKNEKSLLWINGSSLENEDEFELVGIILGLAIYNGIILDIKLPNIVYKKLQNQPVTLHDLEEIDPELVHGLKELLESEEEVEDIYCQTFQVSVPVLGEDNYNLVDLIPGGAAIPITNKNRVEFVNLLVDYELNISISKQFQAFSLGFYKVCGYQGLSLFEPEEIEMLVCGSHELDFDALERSATYDDGYHINHKVVKWFWELAHQLEEEKKRKLLRFVTGSDRVPVKGLSHLPLVIHRSGPDSDRLPTAMTCFNRLMLPEYSTFEKLNCCVRMAIESSKGFGLA